MKEIWKDIEEFEGYYQISNLGQVKSMDRDVIYSNGVIRHYEERIRTPVTDKNGYLMVTLNKSSKSYKLWNNNSKILMSHQFPYNIEPCEKSSNL